MRTQLNVRLPEHTIAQINELAAEMDESQAHVIIVAVDRMAQGSKGNDEMAMYDITNEIVHPNKITENKQVETCVYCKRQVPPGNAVKRIKIIYWFDWDDPDEDAQGQRKSKKTTEWYCCGFSDGFGTLDCYRTIIDLGIDAGKTPLMMIAKSDVRMDIRSQAIELLNELAHHDREVATLLADIDHYSQYDDNSPGQIGGYG